MNVGEMWSCVVWHHSANWLWT